jgi:RNA polymerase sigma-70 factor (ECF subfamily)
VSANGDHERSLVERIVAGDLGALEALYRAYHRRLGRFLDRVTQRHDLIDEAINDTFWVVWRHAKDFRGESQVSTWIMGIAYRTALKAVHHNGSRTAGDVAPAADAGSADDDTALADHERFNWVAKGLDRLTLEQRSAIELAYYFGHSLTEIAAIMDCPVSTVKARMFHAREHLRALLPRLAASGKAASHE